MAEEVSHAPTTKPPAHGHSQLDHDIANTKQEINPMLAGVKESTVTSKIAVRRSSRVKPIYVQKHFDEGWFQGKVDKTRQKEEHGTLHHIVYEDGDEESVDDCELEALVLNFQNDCKREAWQADEPKKKKAKIASKNRRKLKGGEHKDGFKPHTSHNSSLWALLEPVNGKPVTRELIQELANQSPPSELPQNMYHRIPEMVEFFVLMRERQLIQQGKDPQIEIFQKYHWCNNYRELDRGTAYFRSEVLRLLDDLTSTGRLVNKLEYTEHVLAMAVYYRQSNLVDSFASPENPTRGIPRLGEFKVFAKYVRTMQKNGATFFTAAHLNQGFRRYIGYCMSATAKIRTCAGRIARLADFDLGRVCKILTLLPGISTFTSWQIACDMEESCCFGPKVLPDGRQVELPDTFCALGPGAETGIKRIFGEQIATDTGDLVRLATYLRDNREYLLGLAGVEFPLWKNRRVTLKVIEHVTCEFQKFTQIEAGFTQGQRKRRSRAGLDDEKWGQIKMHGTKVCCEGNTMVRCDSCHLIACGGCQSEQFQSIKPAGRNGWNCCTRCHVLDQLTLEEWL